MPFICSETLTIADLLLFEESTNLEIYKIDISKWPKVHAWYERVLQNEAVKEIHDKFREQLPNIEGFLSTAQIAE